MLSKNSRKLFHATMHVTRVEEWFVEAGSAEEAKELLESGQGERSQVGECVRLEFWELIK
jgi:hypothetical protein